MKHAPVPSAFASRRGLLKTSRLGIGERVVAGFIGRRSRHFSGWMSKKVFDLQKRGEIQCEILQKEAFFISTRKKNAFFKTQAREEYARDNNIEK
jgi:hypothetical protein